MQAYSINPTEIFSSFWRNKRLVLALTKREIVGRYQGSMLGLLWSLFNPIFMLIVYTFVFSVVFQAKWSNAGESKSVFALILFAGLIIFNFFAECINRAPGIILANPNYVKKVIFPLEILPWVNIGAALFHAFISILVWLLFYSIEIGIPHATAILSILVFIPLIMLILGLSWGLAALGVYLRDVGQIVGILMSVLMFLSPIFFPITALPISYQPLLKFNPLTLVIEQMRDVLFWGEIPNITNYCIYFISSTIVAWIGFIWFQKTRKGFADVL